MAFRPRGIGYDMAITVFSPDGSLYQVNYASEAVKRGATALGVKCDEGIVLAVDKRIPSKLVQPESFEKIFQVDTHIGAAESGMIADARQLVERARLEAQIHRLTYDEDISVSLLCKKIGDLMQMHTQYGGLRPFGASLIIAGVNEEPELFVTDPSGGYLGWKAAAIGSGRTSALDVFEAEYKDDITMDESILLALKALKPSVEALVKSNVEMALIKDKKFRKMSDDDVKKYIDELRE
ncbi:MAG: archaeal proteasome endopeptidase complex subunit alpha [Theionarchaea archaeon]|nr:MAG: proteasome subunit alpha [Theionarchaea archaeon DG-70-1]MBU7029773.1 archaeal proteasome endopeptidase complex subunit alpha [Theionarchaea archaeon]